MPPQTSIRLSNILLTMVAGLMLLGIGAAFSVTSRLASLETQMTALTRAIDKIEAKIEGQTR